MIVINLLALIVFCSLICVGFYAACGFDGDEDYDSDPNKSNWKRPESGMLLWWVRFYGGRVIPKYWTKPVYSCLTCMGSLHSVIPTLWFCSVSGVTLWIWPLVALGTAGLNYLITILWQ